MSNLIGRISESAKSKGLTFNRIEHDLGLGNGTIKRWSEQSPRLDKLIQVAEYLDVSLDYIVSGTLHSENTPNGEPLACDGVPLSQLEADLIAMLRLLPEDSQKEIFDLVHFKYTRVAGGEKESIYSTYFDENSSEKGDPVGSFEAQDGTA